MLLDTFDIMPNYCSERSIEALELSLKMQERHRHEFLTPEHILLSILTQTEFCDFCKVQGASVDEMRDELLNYLISLDTIPKEEENTFELSRNTILLFKSFEERWTHLELAEDSEDRNINICHLVFSMYELNHSTVEYVLMKHLGRPTDSMFLNLMEKYQDDKLVYIEVTEDDKEQVDANELFSRMMQSAGRLMGALNTLNQLHSEEQQNDEQNNDSTRERKEWEEYVTLLNDTYKTKNPLIGREKELARAIRILCRKDKNNPLFIGEPGVGKTALIYGLVRMIEEGNVPKWLQGQRIYALDMGDMVAGASYHGEFERRMKAVLEGAKEDGNCIIYIDEIHNMADKGNNGNSVNAAELLKPYLEDGTVRFIGCTTYSEYNKTIGNQKAIARRFATIDICEPSVEESIEILKALVPIYEQHHGVKFAEDVVEYIVEQSANLIHDRFLPDKAIDIIDEAGAYRQQYPMLDKNGNPKQTRFQKVDKTLIKQIFTEVCRISAQALTSENNDQLADLDKRISNEIYGQDEAIRQVVRSVMMSKAGLLEADKPIASLLFVGPTGVGKTEVCKVLAKELGIELIRFDMSEYTEKHTISKLIGSPAGYVGYDDGGLLTDAIRKSPNCVLLLDEIEKAHSDIYNILLQVMDYAKLTDSKGNKVDFRNVILIMTSNSGAQFAGQASVGFAGGTSKGQAMLASVKKTFKPEFLNRLSGTVVFNEMDRTMASLILNKKLQQLEQRLTKKSVTLSIDDEARDFLLDKGYSSQYGAREMDRVINQHLTPLLMQEILFGSLKKGGEASITLKDNDLAIK